MGTKVSSVRKRNLPYQSINPKYLISGQIQREFVISSAGVVFNDFLGGNLTYAYAGLRYWEQSIGLISRLSADFPKELLTWLKKMDGDVSGIIQKETSFEQRSFCAVDRDGSYTTDRPLAHYSRVGTEFPKTLLNFDGYKDNQLTPTYQEKEVPYQFLHSEIALVLPEDLSSQIAILSHLTKGTIQKFVLAPTNESMYPRFWNDWTLILKNLDVLLISEKNIQSLFNEPQKSLWDSIETLFSFGLKAVIINKDRLAYWIMDKPSQKRWIIPAYPVQPQYPLGTDAAFAGGFLFGYQKTYDILEGTLSGLVTASLMAGGVTPPSIFDALPGLADARLETMRKAVILVT